MSNSVKKMSLESAFFANINNIAGQRQEKHLPKLFGYRKYFIVSPASIVSPLESKPAKIVQLN